jgi:uncharacterized protein (TIGR03067 family)
MREPAVVDQDLWHDLQPVLDHELSRLPEAYRVALLLCDLEGKTRKEVARQLGLPQGTVASRLARARAMLARRLTRHGLAVSGGLLGAVLSQKAASACVPAAVVSSTIKAASLLTAGQAAAIPVTVAALTEGVLKTMFLTKLKTVMVLLVLALSLVALGDGVIMPRSVAEQPPKEKQPGADPKDPERKSQTPKPNKAALRGTWKVIACKLGGLEQPTEDFWLVITADTIFVKDEGLTKEFTYTLDQAQEPHHMDWVPRFGEHKGQTIKGICRLQGDNLLLCTNGRPDGNRPTAFKSEAGTQVALMSLKRKNPRLQAEKPADDQVRLVQRKIDELIEKAWFNEMIEKGDRKDNLRLFAVLDEIDAKTNTISAIVVGDANQPMDEAAMMQASIFRLMDVRKRQMTTLISLPISKHAKITDANKAIKLGDLIEGKAVMLQLATDQSGLVVIAIRRLRWQDTRGDEKKP